MILIMAYVVKEQKWGEKKEKEKMRYFIHQYIFIIAIKKN